MEQETPPDVLKILAQVESELTAMMSNAETGTIIVYVGGNQLQLECNIKRKKEPVLLDSPHVAYIKRLRS